jgi:hypothetical protein
MIDRDWFAPVTGHEAGPLRPNPRELGISHSLVPKNIKKSLTIACACSCTCAVSAHHSLSFL